MAVSEDYLQYVCDQLAGFGKFETKKMFGGVGFFRDGLMFGMLNKSTFRLKADEINYHHYELRGMTPLKSKDGKRKMPYWQVPDEVLEDRDQLKEWANKAVEASVRTKIKKSKPL